MQDSYLTVSLVDTKTNAPISGANVNIYQEDENTQTTSLIYQGLITDESGQVQEIVLPAPDLILTEEPSAIKPYSQYTVEAIANGYENVVIRGVQMFATVESRQYIAMYPSDNRNIPLYRQNEIFSIGEHTLWGTYPPHQIENSLKPLQPPTGFVVLDNPVIPEFIIVHDGEPSNKSAANYWVPYKEYIKNVASSEIYSTWPEQTIYANVVAIISFTLNRVFTEWYRSKGYDFTITSSTSVDHKYIHNRNLFNKINVVVDDIFTTFIKRPTSARQPLLAQYCDGQKVKCPGQMTQWGSKFLGDEGYTWQNILRYYYGEDIAFEQAPVVTGVPASYPGEPLTIGSSGKDVTTIQNQLNRIAQTYSAIPKVQEDGNYGQSTADTVKKFQDIFGLPDTGVVDFKTWYEISRMYVAITKIASLNPVV